MHGARLFFSKMVCEVMWLRIMASDGITTFVPKARAKGISPVEFWKVFRYDQSMSGSIWARKPLASPSRALSMCLIILLTVPSGHLIAGANMLRTTLQFFSWFFELRKILFLIYYIIWGITNVNLRAYVYIFKKKVTCMRKRTTVMMCHLYRDDKTFVNLTWSIYDCFCGPKFNKMSSSRYSFRNRDGFLNHRKFHLLWLNSSQIATNIQRLQICHH